VSKTVAAHNFVEGKSHSPFFRPNNFSPELYALPAFSSAQEYGQVTIRAHGEFFLQTYNWRSLWDRRPFSFQHMSLYLALNFGYIKGVRKMERDAQKSREDGLPGSLPARSS